MSLPIQPYTIQPLTPPYIQEAARCLAETFAGVNNGSYTIAEPIAVATKLSVDHFMGFFHEYFEATIEQGYHTIAIDNETGRIVGVIGVDIIDPAHEEPPFEGEMAVLNHMTDAFGPLNVALFEKFEQVTGRPLVAGELIHGFLIGVQTPKDKRYVATSLVSYVLEKAKHKGVKGFYVEATNPRSQQLVKEEFQAYVPTDVNGTPITLDYANDPFFHVIPADVATTLEILYIPVDETINMR